MKSKVKKISRRTLSMVLSVLMVFSCLAVGVVTTANATINFWDYNDNNHHYLYYDDSSANISNGQNRNVYFVIGYETYSEAYIMTKLSNSALYFLDFDVKWEGATGYCFGSKTSAPTTGSNISVGTARTNCTAYTSMYTNDGGYDGNSTYFFYADDNKNLQIPSKIGNTNSGDNRSEIKNDVTLSTKKMDIGASSYSDESTNIATLNLQSAWWNNGTPTLSNGDSTNGTKKYENAVVAATTTFSYSSLISAYDFVGWYNSSGTQLSASSQYSFAQQGHKSNITYYAYFKQKYQVTVIDDGHGTAKVNNASSAYVSQGSSISITATPATDYVFDSWEVTAGSITQTASNLTASDSVTPTGNAQTVTLKAKFKPAEFTVNVNADTGGTVSPAQFTDLSPGEGGEITAAPTGSYYFTNWTASPSGNVTFANPNSATTTFTASAAATITAHFTQDTLYPVTVYLDGETSSTVNAGSSVNPEITAAAPSDDEDVFDKWVLTGNVQLATGYSDTNPTVKIKATNTGGTVRATYKHTDYIYFYGALQSNWNSNPYVMIDGNPVSVYDNKWIAQWDETDPDTPVTLYSSSGTSNPIGANSCNTYYIGVYRIAASDVTASSKILVWNSTFDWSSSTYDDNYAQSFTGNNGVCYYTYSSGVGSNTTGKVDSMSVSSVSVDHDAPYTYDMDDNITTSKNVTVYGETKTAGQDTFTYTYKLVNTSNQNEIILAEDLASSENNYSFTPENKNVPVGTYKLVLTAKDGKTGKMTSSAESAAFSVRATPTSAVINFSQTLDGASSAFTGKYTYKGGTAQNITSGTTSLRADSVVTLTLSLNTGYTRGSTSLSGITSVTENYDSATNKVIFTFTVPSNVNTITVNHAAHEITHNVKLYKRYYKSDGTTLISTDSTATTISGAGIATAVPTGNAPIVANYTFNRFTIKENCGVTKASGEYTDSTGITVNATEDNGEIYIDYKETVYDVTVQYNNAVRGTVTAGGESVSAGGTTKVGNVTEIAFSATNNPGYAFDFWEITPASGVTVTIKKTDGSSSSTINRPTGDTAPAANDIRREASLKIRTNGTATVKAHFRAVNYSINANFYQDNTIITQSTWNNNTIEVRTDDGSTSKSDGEIDDYFKVYLTLAPGYKVKSISYTTDSGFVAPTPKGGPDETDNADGTKTVVYRYQLNAGKAAIKITLEAVEPSLSKVKINDTTNTDSCVNTYSANANVNHFYLQPDMVYAETDSFSRLSCSNGTNTATAESTGTTTVTAASNPAVIPSMTLNTVNTVTYTLTVTATNSPAGVDAKTTSCTYTVVVTFNTAQQSFCKLKKLHDRCVDEEEYQTSNNYYESTARLSDYVDAYNAAKSYMNPNNTLTYPAYNADSTTTTEANTQYTNFLNAYNNLKRNAKYTTIYVLSKYSNTDANPMYVNIVPPSTSNRDWTHFRMFCDDEELNEYVNPTTYKLTCENIVHQGSNRYLYTYKYTGHVSFNIWKGSGATDTVMDDGDKLTGTISTITDFGKFYINIYNTSVNTTTVPSVSEYSDFSVKKTVSKPWLEIGDEKNAADLRTLMGIQNDGSVVTAPGIDNISNTTFKIKGPINKPGVTPKETNMLAANAKFKAETQGKYSVTYVNTFGTDAEGHAFTRSVENLYLWVAFDEIDIYVDMNGNVGNPTVNFKYYTNSNGTPVYAGTSGAIVAYLPYEMDLVTGSESVYKTTIKLSKLRGDYKIAVHKENNRDVNDPLQIAFFSFENKYITTAGVQNSKPLENDANYFEMPDQARITGEAWYKADSTSVKKLLPISYGSVTNNFMAAAITSGDNAIALNSAMESVQGTGIVTDEDDLIYQAHYAGQYYVLDESTPDPDDTKLVYDFGYVHRTAARQEVTNGSNTYYFDKWVCFKTPEEGIIIGNNNAVTLDSERTDVPDCTTDINFTGALPYDDGDMTYVALYKPAAAQDAPTRVEITYEFNDYDTSDGNYVFVNEKTTDTDGSTKYLKTTKASYTKIVNVDNWNAANADIVARENMPYVNSVYFDYSYRTGSATVIGDLPEDVAAANATNHKVVVHAKLTETPHTYRIVVMDANGNVVGTPTTGYYQNSVTLTAPSGISNPVWKTSPDSNGQLLGTGAEYSARYMQTGYNTNSGSDCQIIYAVAGDGTENTTNTSVINNAITTFYTENGTERLRHNFTIFDYCGKGNLMGGGILYATVENGSYRQQTAGTNLATKASRESFINRVLGENYSTEYRMQTIENTGFRYKPYNPKESVFNYSDIYHAYITTFESSNVNSSNYEGQKLRVFSFMVYSNQGAPVIVPSEGYAEVERYIDQSN